MPHSHEDQVDAEDWEIFQRTEQLANHWYWRPGHRPGRNYLTWYFVFDDQALRDHIAHHQQALADLNYLDPVPPDGIHMTVQGVGFPDEVSPEAAERIGENADARMADIAPFTLTIGPIASYPGGTFLRAAPWHPVAEVRERLRQAIADELGADQVPAEPARFKPHVSVTYCNATPPAGEVIRRLTELRQEPAIVVPVASVSLLELRREGHTYRWSTRHTVTFTGP
ncbi:2'-5' RNA ligase family protein [Frankia sp. AgB1.9]|uniref:2'-5' RNA ligase family protein n=1 Tax=unclassified Frankia TaxID=2632575 RepID=UPI001931E0B8|nr:MULTISPECIES: 2'-5' RNA ligase family protein [unclassified Frankia]MBL7487623.1 2'-5' RNA ligase family protein [Frankia sp. AgW1.1]MBL7548911.1 2'-5' RNA ligase family protein [Frankia sp. AgB1.9]MBL7624879.1 2'-5' RNA ligase family protein [Frankia sp. AgB1.8]